MITNASGNFQSQRNIPFFTQIQASIQDSVLTLSLKDGSEDSIDVPFPKNEAKNQRQYR